MDNNVERVTGSFYYMRNHPHMQTIGYLQYTKSDESKCFSGRMQYDEEGI